VQAVTLWDSNRTDWLLGTTLRGPREAKEYKIDGVSVARIALSREARLRLLPWVPLYPVLQGAAIERMAEEISAELAPWAEKADLIHNGRIGREGISYASLLLARQRDIPFVITPVHHPRWSGWLHRFYHEIYRHADGLIALTEAEKKTLVSLGVNEEKIHITGIGPILAGDANGERFTNQYNIEGQKIVLFLGQKYPYKGLASLLEAAKFVWQRIPETVFLFIGPRTSYSKRLFEQVKVKKVIELNSVSLEEKTDALAACSLLCVPSSQESFGGVYTEAWYFEKPVIGCNIPAVAEVISEGEDGFLVTQEARQIAERIIYLLENPDEACRLGKNGKHKVEERFTWPKLAELTERIYLNCVEKG